MLASMQIDNLSMEFHDWCLVRKYFKLIVFLVLSISVCLRTEALPRECDLTSNSEKDGCRSKEDWFQYSKEAHRGGLNKFLMKIKVKYFDLHHEELIFKPAGVELQQLKEKFKPYNPHPKNLKRVWDTARVLPNELLSLKINPKRLKAREKKVLAQTKHYLEHNFGSPYDKNYYSGLFLLGPDLFCWQPICRVGLSDIRYGLANLRIHDLKDVKVVMEEMELVAQTFSQYISNLRLGVKSGMVRSIDECEAAFKQSYLQVSLRASVGMSTRL